MEARDARDAPTAEEFEEARQRELARLNVRVSSTTGKTYHTPEDAKLLEHDTADQRSSDMDTVRRWAANPDKSEHGGGKKPAYPAAE